jgi:hypothetical protein
VYSASADAAALAPALSGLRKVVGAAPPAVRSGPARRKR